MKVLKRVLLWTGIILLALIVFVVGSVVVDGWFAEGRLDPITNTTLTAADGETIRAYVAKPEGPGPHPAVIMIHEFYGLRSEIVGKADALAKEGYVVIAPHVFRGGTTNWIPRAIYNVISADPNQVDSDVDVAYEWLVAQSDVQADRIGIMGFCFGGGTSLRYSLSNNQLAATVIFYGQPIGDPEKLKSLSGPVLGIFGEVDQSIPLEEVEAMRAGLDQAGVPHEVIIYEGQPHAFLGSMEEVAQGGVDRDAWNTLLEFLRANLQDGTGAAESSSLTHDEAARGIPTLKYVVRLALSHLFHMEHPGHAG